MKVLFLPAYFHPEQDSSFHLSADREIALINNGIDIVAYCATPTRGISSDVRLYYKHKKKELLYNGHLTIYRFQLFREGKSAVLRTLRYLICVLKQFNRLLFCKPAKECDIIWISSTPPGKCALISIAARLHKIPIVLNLQDIFPDSLVGTGLAKRGGVLWKFGRIIENITYRNSEKIVVISNDFKKNIMDKGVPEDKIVVIYNWVDENAVVPVDKEHNMLYNELGINREKFSVVYAGNFGHAQNINVIIDAAEILKDIGNIQFLMFGSGGLVEDYKKIANEKGLRNMFFFPLQPFEKVSQVYSLGDLAVVACKKGLGKGAFPSKTWSIMSAGTPIIASYDEDTDLERLVKNNAVGVFSVADDSQQMAERILDMYNNQDLCAEYGCNARKYILDYVSKEKSTQKYVDVIKQVVEDNTNVKAKSKL